MDQPDTKNVLLAITHLGTAISHLSSAIQPKNLDISQGSISSAEGWIERALELLDNIDAFIIKEPTN